MPRIFNCEAKKLKKLPRWGRVAVRGADKDMIRVGKLVVAEMQKHGLVVKWDGSANKRPLVLLSEKIKGQK